MGPRPGSLEGVVAMDFLENFYQDKRVLITGHTGFKGSWLTIWLTKMGAKVCGLSLTATPTAPSLFTEAALSHGIRHIEADIRDYTAVAKAFDSFKPEIVFHLAAQALVLHSYKNPVETYGVNVMGTVHVLEAARRCTSVRAIINVTSDKCYENKELLWGYRECDPMGGSDPYSSSKGCAELVSQAYLRSFFNAETSAGLASVRAGNVIGGGDWGVDRLVPDFIRSIVAGEKLELRSPKAVRPWQHVLEPLRGYLQLAEKLYNEPHTFAGGWNFGPSQTKVYTVEAIAQELCEIWPGGGYTISPEAVFHEATWLKLDWSKAHYHLGWEPILTVRKALRLIVDWNLEYYQNNLRGRDLRELCLRQILHYLAIARKEDV